MNSLSAKIDSTTAVIGVIGLGYVGLPLLAAFHRAGFPTIGFDVDPKKIDDLRHGRTHLKHLGADLTANLLEGAKSEATADFSRLREADAILICVPTPLGRHL